MSESGYDDNKRPDKTYVSKSLPSFGDEARKVRIASKVFQSPDDYAFALVHNELVLRHTKGGKRIIKAKFFEDNRKIFVLNIQGYTYATDKPHNASFAFIGDEIGKLQEFLNNIQSVPFRDEGGVNVSDEQLRRMVLSDKQVKTLLAGKHELVAEILRSEVTKEDIVAVGYRRKQLDTFERLLADAEFFAKIKAKKGLTNECLWQSYFEKNTWVFGYGLGYIFLSALDESKLEQVVQGHSVAGYGKRVDALMRTRGVISSLCFVEIKTHTTPLLAKTPYRVGCWAPSEELAGAVSQVQGTVHSATEPSERS